MTYPSDIPEVVLEPIADFKTDVEQENCLLPKSHTLALLTLLVRESPSCVLEIGTFNGHTTKRMAEALPSAIIHTVDLPPNFKRPIEAPQDDFHLIDNRVVGKEFAGQPCASRIIQHFGDTATWDFKAAGHPTFFFIDGSHTYAYVKNDSEKCFKLCEGKGMFVWHDCWEGKPGVIQLLMDWRAMGRDVRRVSGTPIAYWKSNPN